MIADLMTRAAKGDKHAWDALVERFVPLIWSICRRYRLGDADAEDVSQNVWLHLADQLGKIRDSAALPGWLATTTRRECLRVLRTARAQLPARYTLAAEVIADDQAATVEQEVLRAERHAALREAFAALPPSGQRLIAPLLECTRMVPTFPVVRSTIRHPALPLRHCQRLLRGDSPWPPGRVLQARTGVLRPP